MNIRGLVSASLALTSSSSNAPMGGIEAGTRDSNRCLNEYPRRLGTMNASFVMTALSSGHAFVSQRSVERISGRKIESLTVLFRCADDEWDKRKAPPHEGQGNASVKDIRCSMRR